MSPTARQRLAERLRRGPATVRELARELGLREAEVADHLEHVARSLRPGERLAEEPAACLACGFAFRGRRRVRTPSRCPRCKSERIAPAVLRIEPPGRRKDKPSL
ncbi:MAG: hypothetical protein Kow0092_11700 [Deferrisomatales bacterium]